MAQVVLDQIGVRLSSTDGNTHWLLKNISLACYAGERVGVIGRNGSGKTTLARLIGGLESPTTGKLSVDPKHTRIMLVLQRPEEHFVRETVGQQIASYASRRLNTTIIHSLMAKVGLPSEVENYPPLRLSGGYQRLVAVACALATEASFLILDEPVAGLDSYGRRLVTQSLAQLNEDKELGLIIISHHPDDLLGLIDRLWILDEGALIYDGLFSDTPVTLLSQCLAQNDSSIYYILRQLESRGVSLPKTVYSRSKPEEISKLLLGSQPS